MKLELLTLLKSRRFLPLFITQFLGAFNDNVFKNALVILITYKIAESMAADPQVLVTLAAGIFILPFFLFSATAGQIADKYEKSRLISIIKFIEIILMGLASFGFCFNNLLILFFILFALGTHSTFFGPLKYAILPEHLQENELIAGNGLIEAGTFLAILIGTIIGGILILRQNGSSLISSIMLVAAIAGWLNSWIIPKTHHSDSKIKVSYNIFKKTFELLQYSKQRRDLFLCILGISWFWLFGATILAEFPVFVKNILHANSSLITLFLTLFSFGIGIGSILCNSLLKGKIDATYVPLAALGMTLFTFDFCIASTHFSQVHSNSFIEIGQFLATFNGWRIVVDLLSIAICGGIFTVPLYAILQHRSEEHHRARIIASNNVMNALFMVASAIIVMFLLKLGFTVTHIFLTLAVSNAIVSIYICKLLPDALIQKIFRTLLAVLYRVKVMGMENYHNAGKRVVIIANHTSFIDAILLCSFLPDKLTFAVNTNISKKWWIRVFLKLIDAYPLDPTNPMAIKSLIEYVKQDKRCVIFPEGRLTVTGTLMKIYEGPGLITDKASAELLPIRIQGAQYTPFSRLRKKIRTQWFPKITITIFPARKLDIADDVKGRLRRQKIGYKLYDIMTEMMFNSSDIHKTLFAALLDAKSTHGSRHQIIEDIERKPLNYHQFIIRCFVLGLVIAKSTKVSEHIGILLPNMVSNALTFFSLQAFNRVPALLNYSTGTNLIINACQTANIKKIISSRKFIRLAKLSDLIDELSNAECQIIYLEDLHSSLRYRDILKGYFMAMLPRISYRLINANQKSKSISENAATILFTSGSEGSPKGVVLSHRNIQANRFQLSACVDFTANDKVFNALPIFHSFGLTGGLLLPLLSGIEVFLYPSPLHYRIVPELSYDTNSTILFGTDTFLKGYAKYAHPYDFYSVRYVFAGAEKLREETRIVWSQKFGVRIFEGYGATETSPVLATNTPMQNKVGTVGRFLPGIEYQLEKVPGIEEGGQLKVFGPNIMKGYLLNSQPGVLACPVDGWYETGDVVSVDDAGFVSIKDRMKRFAKIAGEMVSLSMVEQEINLLWPEYQHAVVNIPDVKKGEQLILVTNHCQATRDKIVTHMRYKQISEIAIPKSIVVLEKMPLLGTGKIDYQSIKKLLLNSHETVKEYSI